MRVKKFKTGIIFPFLFFLVFLSKLYAQKQVNMTIKAKLDTLASVISNGGIYERTINFGYVFSPTKFKRGKDLSAHNELTMVIMRFEQMEYDTVSLSYIGKVFFGERYLEKYYNKMYKNIDQYKNDSDGFYMSCKLYHEDRSGEFRLNLYPNYVLNICSKSGNPLKGMHYNSVTCKSTEEHWKSLKYLTALNDIHYDNFSDSNDSSAILSFLKVDSNRNINIFKGDVSYSDLPKRKKSLIRELNLRKEIKCFSVAKSDVTGSDISSLSLRLKYTKYSLSEDFIDASDYEFRRLSYSAMDDVLLKLRSGETARDSVSSFITKNSLYKSLITSGHPDDSFVPDMDLAANVNVFYLRDTLNRTAASNTVKGQTLKESFKSDSLINYLQRVKSTSRPESAEKELSYKPLVNFQNKVIAVTSSGREEEHWIFHDPAVQDSLREKEVRLVLKRPVFLRDTLPSFIPETREWIKGGIKSNINSGIADTEYVWSIINRKSIVDGRKSYLWLRVRRGKKL